MPYCDGIEVFPPYPAPPNYRWEFKGCLDAGNGLWRLVENGGGSPPPILIPPPDLPVPVPAPTIPLPRAAFSYRIYAGGLVGFTNTSLNNPTSFLWNFGDGSTSMTRSPYHFYSSAGTRTVTLTVQNSGGINSISQSVAVTILAEAANYTYVKSGLKVFITDTSTVLGSVFSYDWGDGWAVSTEQNPVHTYAVAGDYLIRQVVNGTYVKEQTVSVVATTPVVLVQDSFTDINGTLIQNHTPEIGNAWYNPVTWYLKIYSNSLRAEIGSQAALWAISTTPHSGGDLYAQAKVYGLSTLASASGSIWLIISNTSQPNETLRIYSDALFLNNVQAESFSYTPGATYRIERDGDTVYALENGIILLSAPSIGSGASTSGFSVWFISYYYDGYQTRIDDYEAGGEVAIIEKFKPIASFSTDVSSGIAPLTVQFTDTSTGTPTSWLWEWGDGTANETTQNPIHIFTTAGYYTVRFTVANDYGTSSYIKTIHVSSVQIELTTLPPIASFTADAYIVIPNTIVVFTDTSTGGTAVSWSWKKNGTQFLTTQNATHQFTTAGVWTVSLTVTDAAGMSSTATHTIIVTSDTDPSDNRPVATIVTDKSAGFAPLTVAFSATVSTPDIFYLWDFGDGSTLTSASVSHTYTHSGVYTVTLTTTNLYGSTQTTIVIVIADVRYADLSVIGYYIIDKVNHKILIYGMNGALISAFGGFGSGLGKFNSPTCVLVNR